MPVRQFNIYILKTGTFCGVFRRQALDRGAIMMKVDKIVTG
jgi:tRNA(Ile)-lysidine synthase TilS/MesJ